MSALRVPTPTNKSFGVPATAVTKRFVAFDTPATAAAAPGADSVGINIFGATRTTVSNNTAVALYVVATGADEVTTKIFGAQVSRLQITPLQLRVSSHGSKVVRAYMGS